MYPYKPQPHQQKYYPPLQSQGFRPPPQPVWPPQQHPYRSDTQSSVSNYAQQHQYHPQYPQQPPGQYYQQSHEVSPQQQHYAPHPSPVASHTHNQGHYSPAPAQTHVTYAPFSQSPMVPPVRASSRSPDKSGRPLPAPAATGGSPSMPPSGPMSGFAPHTQSPSPSYASQTSHPPVNQPVSSFSRFPTPQTFPGSQSFRTQTHVDLQAQPQAHRTPLSHIHPSLPHLQTSPNGTPPSSPTWTSEPSSKRPLPAPPSGAAASPPATLSRLTAPGAAGSPVQRRALPFPPTKPPNVESARSIEKNRIIKAPQRSSTLPTLPTSKQGIPEGVPSAGSKDDTEQTSTPRTSFARDTIVEQAENRSARSTRFALPPGAQSKPSGSFAPPKQQEKPTQSLTFRLASLSFQEEQSQKRAPHDSALRISPVPEPVLSKNPSAPPSQLPRRSIFDLDDSPPFSSIRGTSYGSKSSSNIPPPQPPSSIPTINAPDDKDDEDEDYCVSMAASNAPSISISIAPSINVFEAPSVAVLEPLSVAEVPTFSVSETPNINTSEAQPAVDDPPIPMSEATPNIDVSEHPTLSTPSAIPDIIVADLEGTLATSMSAPAQRRKGLVCYGCEKGILGRVVSAMGGRWHPACFKCTVCSELLEHVSSYEHGGKPYCHLDYYEKFAPQCYHCRTPIIDERFITLDDAALGKRTYHEQHFFCAECGDPFLPPTIPEKKLSSSGVVAQDDDVGFTVYNGHPYCEVCHVRLRYPKCKRCKKSIRDGMRAVEALGGKWCWGCFLCAGCEKPFDEPTFFQRESKAFCETCFSIIIKSEL